MGPPKTASNGVHDNGAPALAGGPGCTDQTGNSPVLRNKMKQYWQEYSPSLESMMLSHDAPHLSLEEQREMMDTLPQCSYVGNTVLELGAGIGRYTTILSEGGARQLTSVDFMESYVEENKRVNGHRDNVTLLCADVTKLNFSSESFDLVFSNWLLMYLTNSEVKSLLQRALTWLKPNGYLFIRESCYHSSGNVARNENPTVYRTPLDYAAMLHATTADDYGYTLIRAKSVRTYVENYGNPNQLSFLVRKEACSPNTPPTTPCTSTIALGEAVRGQTWQSPGGCTIAQIVSSRLGSLAGKTVLDAECGTGGLAFLLAQSAGRVAGLTSSPELLHHALRHQGAQDVAIIKKVTFECAVLQEWSTNDRYDVIVYSGSSPELCTATISKLKTLLTKRGMLLLTAYTTGDGVLSNSGTLRSAATRAGLRDIIMIEHSSDMVEALGKEVSALKDESEQLQQFPSSQTQSYNTELQATLGRLRTGELAWNILQASG